MITTEKVGRRIYLRGDTYPLRDRIRAAGGRWDADQRAWWIGAAKEDIAKRIAALEPDDDDDEPDASNTYVAGRVTYRDRSYYAVSRDRDGYDGVRAVQSRDGSRILLAFRDGSRQFWADSHQVAWQQHYRKPMTIARLQQYKEELERQRPIDAPVLAKHRIVSPTEVLLDEPVDAAPDPGDTFTERGKRYLVVRHGRRFFHSEDECEEMDCFCGNYEWHVELYCVEIAAEELPAH